ncbi:heme A synthase [Methylobacterium terricola]|uniref:Heme A synthase n=1 Tax=Methylobacterium terricola TaxID=2583531 RepID=A0A5C4LGT2_9HYPH|nr:COX15/CtaA family protein [Methylobacterium terricola]TNC13336.1 heme A synthase [Methylobacterium terricola]
MSSTSSISLAPSAVPAAAAPRSRRAVRTWLFVMAALVVAMVAVGGTTRLTGSGLSITEWKPVTGAIPPLSGTAWAEEFAKYQATPQYKLINQGMSLSEFQFIYAWEWGHRLLGRLLGLAFFLPLLVFWWRGQLDRRLSLSLLGLGLLGGLQGTVGWIMVASGLQPGMTAVAPIKLTLHLTLASAIYAGLVWLASGLDRRRDEAVPARISGTALAMMALVLVQVALGGLVAGSKAGLTYNTWPLMDGSLVPAGLFAGTPWIENFVDNVALVQFNHRLTAYALLALAIVHAADARRTVPGTGAARRATALAGLVVAQATLGIVTLLLAVPFWAGLAHQVAAMVVLGMATAHARLCRAPAPAVLRTV